MKVLVTGGAGYIGSHVVNALVEAGHDVVVADNFSTGFRDAVHKSASVYIADIRDSVAMDRLFSTEKFSGVVHLAAFSQVGESMEDPLKYYENNCGGTATLLRAMMEHDVNAIVFSSSAAVYGTPDKSPITESCPLNPINCYGETKMYSERMMEHLARLGKLKYVALRYFNACGAHPYMSIGEAHAHETHLIPLVLQVAAGQRDKICIYGDDYETGDGTCIRDYVHVCDLARAHVLALYRLLLNGESGAYNLGTGAGFTVKEVIEAARRVTEHPIPVEICERRKGDPDCLVASSAKARNTFGWIPQYDVLDLMIETAWRWHRSHPNGYSR